MIQQYYELFNEKQYTQMLELLDDHVTHEVNQGKSEVGKDLFKKFMSIMEVHYDEHLKDICIMISDDGRRGSAEFICEGTYLKTTPGLPEARGQTYQIPVGCFFEFKGMKISRITNYYNLNHWIDAIK